MHIYFSGIGGSGIGPIALLAKQAGYNVSGSDKQESAAIEALRAKGITAITIGQSYDDIAAAHKRQPIDWFVYSSALALEQPNAPELRFCKDNSIKATKRDIFLNALLEQKRQKLIAVTGTHGKSTTTAMVVWLFLQLKIPVSYVIGAKIPFGDTGHFDPNSEYFVYECDEFDRNFLAFTPYLSAITGIAWDHHEIFPTAENYNQAFRDFIQQSNHTLAWDADVQKIHLQASDTLTALDPKNPAIDEIRLAGRFNRLDAWLAIQTVAKVTEKPPEELQTAMEQFPGLRQRMEQLAPNLYTNYAHTPEKIRGGISTAQELAKPGQKLVIIYEPLTNRRQHYIRDQYKDTFAGVSKLYWVPSYLAREDPNLPVLTPEQLIKNLSDPTIAEPAKLDEHLLTAVTRHLQAGDLVVAMGASGAGSVDEWLRKHFGR